MVMYPPRHSSSTGMRSIRRELERRRSKRLAPTRSVATKPSAPLSQPLRRCSGDAGEDPRRRPPQRDVPSSTISNSRGSAGTDASPQPRPRASSRRTHASPPPPPPRPAPSSTAGSACQATPGVPEHLIPGTVVRVRTRTGTMKTGHVLVLWLKATIVSSTHGGYEVVYDGDWPRGDPKGAVHVERHHVRVMNPSPPAPPTAAVAARPKKEMPRPTTAGKSLRLIRNLFPEMELPTRADL